jgi:hypothetical protein
MLSPLVTALLGSHFTVLHSEDGAAYSVLEWRTPPEAPSPPLHLHHRTDEGFYVLEGRLCLVIDDKQPCTSPARSCLFAADSATRSGTPANELRCS